MASTCRIDLAPDQHITTEDLSFLDGEDRAESTDGSVTDFLKDKGNAAFKLGHFERAKFFYSASLLKTHDAERQSVLFANRSAVNLKLGLFHYAAADAHQSILLQPHNVKGHMRLATSFMELGSLRSALTVLQQALDSGTVTKASDRSMILHRMEELCSEDSGMYVLTKKKKMGLDLDDPSMREDAIFGYAALGTLCNKKNKSVSSNASYFERLFRDLPVEACDTVTSGRAVFARRSATP